MRTSSVEQRFWAKVQGGDPQGCWLWTAAHGLQGHGTFTVRGRTVPAHRWAYEHLRAEIPEGLHIDHLCSNPPCVNPWHLEPVTAEENNRRTAQRGRNFHSIQGRVTLTPVRPRRIPRSYRQIADDLRARIAAGGFPYGTCLPTYQQLAEQYRAGITTVQKAMRLLMAEGLVVGVQGAGLYVAEEKT